MMLTATGLRPLATGSTTTTADRNASSSASCPASSSQGLCCRLHSVFSCNPGQAAPVARRARHGRPCTAVRAVDLNEEDLLQFPDRLKWYESKFCADAMPDWNVAKFVGSRDVAPEMRAITLEVEISRERIPLRAAYKTPGQKAAIRVQGGVEHHLAVATPPFSQELNKHPLFLVRGDLFAYEIKSVREPVSVQAHLEVLVGEREAPELYHLEGDEVVEVGAFQGTGLDLRQSGLMAIYRFPTIVMFVTGKGIATARALLEATTDVAGLNPELRKQVRMYYKVRNQASLVFNERFDAWSEAASHPSQCKLVVVPTTEPTFQQAFDNDDDLMYDPMYTAAVILTGGDAEAEAEARAVCKEAEITTILSDATEAAEVVHLDSTPTAFRKWKQDRAN